MKTDGYQFLKRNTKPAALWGHAWELPISRRVHTLINFFLAVLFFLKLFYSIVMVNVIISNYSILITFVFIQYLSFAPPFKYLNPSCYLYMLNCTLLSFCDFFYCRDYWDVRIIRPYTKIGHLL